MLESLRRTKSLPLLDNERGIDVASMLSSYTKVPSTQGDSEDSFDLDYTIFKELRDQDLQRLALFHERNLLLEEECAS